jgi:hypothetical protein
MIYFQPGDSGINSMLGQMMWFKRFVAGHNIDFDFAVDLDHSPRNYVTTSIHNLLFGPRLRQNTNIDFDESIGLNAFFEQVRTGKFRLNGRKLRILAGDIKNPAEPGLWRSHAFQLHCLEKGFLADRYPYWVEDLSEFTREGELADSGRISAPGQQARLLFAHLRLGDSAVLSSAKVSELTGRETPGYMLASSKFMSQDEYELYRMGLHKTFPPPHYAERGARNLRPETMAQAMRAAQGAAGSELTTIFATDGYSRAAAWLSPRIGLSAAEIEPALNTLLHPVTSLADQNLIGETGDTLVEVLGLIAQADILLTTSSLFVPTVKCALSGRQALDHWTMLDESDTLSRYLQLPTVVDHPPAIFQACLEKLAAEDHRAGNM